MRLRCSSWFLGRFRLGCAAGPALSPQAAPSGVPTRAWRLPPLRSRGTVELVGFIRYAQPNPPGLGALAPMPPARGLALLPPRRAHAKRTPGAGGLRDPWAALGDDSALDELQQPLLPQDPGHGEGGAQRLPQPGKGPSPHQVQAQGPDAALEAEGLINGEILLETLVQLQREGRLPVLL